ncbi:hypothetical protein DPMN_157888 [Dreissena polymorpha]|uniref:Uncharacterized protein n=1 Tax=Dreissena polymorpha TaxID=45954 RepID=A0A9D4IQF0_DREPO|nr:hypothetical protein DPMN_157888 [Dreissena polymorpha]
MSGLEYCKAACRSELFPSLLQLTFIKRRFFLSETQWRDEVFVFDVLEEDRCLGALEVLCISAGLLTCSGLNTEVEENESIVDFC